MNKILHTMLRVKDLGKSIDFYTKALGMTLLRTSENTQYRYTIIFLGYSESSGSTIELTYNWDTDSYNVGDAFGHIAIGVNDIIKATENITSQGGEVTRQPGPVLGGDTIIAFAKDPDGYMIELIEI